MRVQVIRTISIVATLIASGCSPMPTVQLWPGLPVCEGHSDIRGLSVLIFHAEEDANYIFDAGSMKKIPIARSDIRRIPQNDSGLNHLMNIREAFPKEQGRLSTGELLGFPAASSPDGRKWAAAIVTGAEKRTAELVIRNQADFYRVRNLDGFGLGTMAWKSDSALLAVIEKSSTSSTKSVRDVLSPHPVPYSDVVLTVYRASGDRVCQSMLVGGGRYVSVRAEWR